MYTVIHHLRTTTQMLMAWNVRVQALRLTRQWEGVTITMIMHQKSAEGNSLKGMVYGPLLQINTIIPGLLPWRKLRLMDRTTVKPRCLNLQRILCIATSGELRCANPPEAAKIRLATTAVGTLVAQRAVVDVEQDGMVFRSMAVCARGSAAACAQVARMLG